MKLVFIFLIFYVAASNCTIISNGVTQKPVTKELLVFQQNVLKLMNNILMKNVYEPQIRIASTWKIIDNKDRFKNDRVVDEFWKFWTAKSILPRGKLFSISYDVHRLQAIALFNLFYFAKDLDTLYKTASWARDNVNEGMFVYSLTVAILHRKDTQGIVLPAPYEVYPYFFLNTEIIQKGQQMKTQEKIYDYQHATFFGIHKVDNTYYIDGNYSGWYLQTNDETKISYFMEDVGLNSYYFYFHADYPFWMNSETYGLDKDRRGEMFYYVHQQILARYYMERLSNDLGEIPKFMWSQPIKTGFMSNLRYHNGMELPSRPNLYTVKTDKNIWDVQDVQDDERYIRDAIRRGFAHTVDGKAVLLTKPEDVNTIGNIIQGNKDSPNPRFFGYLELMTKRLIGNSEHPFHKFYTVPSVLEQYETALRDPMFYQIYKRFMRYVTMFKDYLPPYTRDEFNFTGVKVQDVTVDKLVTFFDNFNIDITNAFYRKPDEVENKKDDYVFITRQRRLNHEAFKVNIEVTSEQATKSIVRLFIGPKFDGSKHELTIDQMRLNFFELDTFKYDLKPGKNVIIRNSQDFIVSVKDGEMTRDFMRRIDDALKGKGDYVLDKDDYRNGFPDRLILPKGKKGGMTFVLFVMISPYRAPKSKSDVKVITDDALGFPFDRRIMEHEFYTPNMFFKDVMIYHRTSNVEKSESRDFMDTKHWTDRDSMHTNVDRHWTDRDYNRNYPDQKQIRDDYNKIWTDRRYPDLSRMDMPTKDTRYPNSKDLNTRFMDRDLHRDLLNKDVIDRNMARRDFIDVNKDTTDPRRRMDGGYSNRDFMNTRFVDRHDTDMNQRQDYGTNRNFMDRSNTDYLDNSHRSGLNRDMDSNIKDTRMNQDFLNKDVIDANKSHKDFTDKEAVYKNDKPIDYDTIKDTTGKIDNRTPIKKPTHIDHIRKTYDTTESTIVDTMKDFYDKVY